MEVILYAFALLGGPPLDCGERRCKVAEFRSMEVCRLFADTTEEARDPYTILRCLPAEDSRFTRPAPRRMINQ